MLPNAPQIIPLGRICHICKQHKPFSNFCRDAQNKTGHSYRCVKCNSARTKLWRSKNRKKALTTNRKIHLRKTYGISPETFKVLLTSQGHKCAICRVVLEEEHRHTCIDHCHRTGVVRGILCRKCNTGIGQFGDNPEKMELAIKYLKDREVPA